MRIGGPMKMEAQWRQEAQRRSDDRTVKEKGGRDEAKASHGGQKPNLTVQMKPSGKVVCMVKRAPCSTVSTPAGNRG